MLHEGLQAKGVAASLIKLCTWFDLPRRILRYKPRKAVPKDDPRFADPIKARIEEERSFGYRTAWLQQEHCPADLSSHGLASQEATVGM